MSTLITDSDDIIHFIAVFGQTDLAIDIAPKLSCTEVDALAGLLQALGEPAFADTWVEAHAVEMTSATSTTRATRPRIWFRSIRWKRCSATAANEVTPPPATSAAAARENHGSACGGLSWLYGTGGAGAALWGSSPAPAAESYWGAPPPPTAFAAYPRSLRSLRYSTVLMATPLRPNLFPLAGTAKRTIHENRQGRTS
ncbi:hypothetical protein [Leifsonia aquatica]|uniref:hypothetical protein n=1 Tax=Leifsonia aquatica TaxID=144185 RepID=UPI0028A85E5C|nr:hypothetical protein [Leifsonia aquatica]